MKDRTEQLHLWYVANRERLLKKYAAYRAAVKADPVAYRAHIEKARLYKRKVFGWKRTYRRREKAFWYESPAHRAHLLPYVPAVDMRPPRSALPAPTGAGTLLVANL